MDAPARILCINRGSSSLKFTLYAMSRDERTIAGGAIDAIGRADSRLRVEAEGNTAIDEPRRFADTRGAVGAIFDAIDRLKLGRPDAVGHRIVHGGPRHAEPELVTDDLIAALRETVPFAPLHLPPAIDAIEAVRARFAGLPQVACFDTAFHRTMPEVAARLPLGSDLWDAGVRRYGFHGLSYEYIVDALGPGADGRVIIAHLGNGASLAAVKNRRSIDTTMGFTPTGGLMMGTRSGDLDPGVILYLLRERRWDAAAIERMVDREGGLLAVSGISSDMRTLAQSDDPRAKLARAMFCHHVRKYVGAMAAVLDGVDILVFTGGIGEHDAEVRAEVCGGLAHLGIEIDPARNFSCADPISAPSSRCVVRVIPANEDLIIARHTRAIIAGLARSRRKGHS